MFFVQRLCALTSVACRLHHPQHLSQHHPPTPTVFPNAPAARRSDLAETLLVSTVGSPRPPQARPVSRMTRPPAKRHSFGFGTGGFAARLRAATGDRASEGPTAMPARRQRPGSAQPRMRQARRLESGAATASQTSIGLRPFVVDDDTAHTIPTVQQCEGEGGGGGGDGTGADAQSSRRRLSSGVAASVSSLLDSMHTGDNRDQSGTYGGDFDSEDPLRGAS